MKRVHAFVLIGLMSAGLTACDRGGPQVGYPPPAAAIIPPPPAPKPPPAKPMVMVCKSSRTGLSAECGTSGAVMVGMKPADAR